MAQCQYCGGEYGGDNPGALAAHERSCDENPNNQDDALEGAAADSVADTVDDDSTEAEAAEAGEELAGGDDADTGEQVDADDLDDPDDTDTQDAFDDDNEVDGDPDAGDVTDDLDDDDAEDYHCGNCGTEVDYLGGVDRDGGGKECPECGERLLWSKV